MMDLIDWSIQSCTLLKNRVGLKEKALELLGSYLSNITSGTDNTCSPFTLTSLTWDSLKVGHLRKFKACLI